MMSRVIGKVLGPYRLVRELGSGSMGTVYLAQVEGSAPGLEGIDQVAIKVVHSHLLSTPGFFKRFLREADIGRQVDHPNVVRTLDADATVVDDHQVNFLVLEYVEGRSLRELLSELRTVPEALLREIAVQMAAGLEGIHRCGIIHRDLKPENVLITDDDVVRIMDLGVAKLQEVTMALTREGTFAGSFLYAAPEQFHGRDLGPSADLYSLGIMLHELATGSCPFPGTTPSEMIHSHLSDEPTPILQINPDVSEFLSELVGVLLSKKPDGRFRSAAELREILIQGDDSSWWREHAQQIRSDQNALPTIHVRRDTRLCGRRDELQELHGAWADAQIGAGNVVLIEGEAGIGKTRLVDEFLRTMVAEDVHALYGAYSPSGGMGGLSSSILSKFGTAGLERSLRPYLTVTPSLVPAFSALLRHENPPEGQKPISAESIQAVACHLLAALSEEKPTIWVLDELHYAPLESRQLILDLAQTVAGQRVLFVLVSRPGLPEDETSYLSRQPSFRRIGLGRLSPREVVQLLQEAFRSENLAERLSGKIAWKADGIPFFILEIVRDLKATGQVETLMDGTLIATSLIEEITVPSAVRDLIGSRLRDISDEDRNLLDVASVIGLEFDPNLVAGVLDSKRIHVLQRFSAIWRRAQILQPVGSNYRFDHNQIQEILYSEIPESLRRTYHELVSQAYEAREGFDRLAPEDVPPDAVAFLARHFLRGSNPRSGLRYLDPALRHLSAANRSESVIELAELALSSEGLLPGRDSVHVLITMADALGFLGRREEQGEAARRAVEMSRSTGDPAPKAEARRCLGWYLWSIGRYGEARTHFDEGLALAEAAECEATILILLGSMSAVLGMTGEYEEALDFARRAHGDRASHSIGLFEQYLGRPGDALVTFERSIDDARESGDERLEGFGLVNLGRLLATLGAPRRGREVLLEAEALLRSLGLRRPEAYARHRLGLIAHQMGDLEEAERRFTSALALRREIRYPSGIAESLVRLGVMKLIRKCTSEAKEHLVEARSLAREIGVPGEVVLASVRLASMPDGDLAAARRDLESYSARLRVEERMEACYVLYLAGRDDRDLIAAYEVLESLIENAPPEFREGMQANVPLHRGILKRQESLTASAPRLLRRR